MTLPPVATQGARRGRGTGARVRSHCRFRHRGTKYVSDSGMKWMIGSTKRQSDRALAGGHRAAAGVAVPSAVWELYANLPGCAGLERGRC